MFNDAVGVFDVISKKLGVDFIGDRVIGRLFDHLSRGAFISGRYLPLVGIPDSWHEEGDLLVLAREQFVKALVQLVGCETALK